MRKLKHLFFDNNRLAGQIPSTIGTLSESLTTLRLDNNLLEGPIPSNITQLILLAELYLSNNELNGSIPDLSTLNSLTVVDLSNNSFLIADVPAWFSSSTRIMTIVMENCGLDGAFPSDIFASTTLESLILRDNSIGGSLQIAQDVNPTIKNIDLRFNNITDVPIGFTDTSMLMPEGNPICTGNAGVISLNVCSTEVTEEISYSTNKSQRKNSVSCTDNSLIKNPRTCECALPYEGMMILRAPSFKDLRRLNRFRTLESSLIKSQKLENGQGAVFICCITFDKYEYFNIKVQFFPADGIKYFNISTIEKIAFTFSNQIYKPPTEFGPYYFLPSKPYIIPGV